MRRLRLALMILMSAVLTGVGCDDGDSDPQTPMADQGMGGAGGEGGAGGTGGAGGAGAIGGEGGAGGAGGVIEACDCGPGCADVDCVEAAPCAGDPGCRAGRICEAEACVPGCSADADCAGTPDTPLCVLGRCGNCEVDGDCFGAARCSPLRICEPPGECSSSRECVGGRCDFQTRDCQPRFDCRGADTCPGDIPCQADTGECQPRTDGVCTTDAECALGAVCATIGRERRCGACVTDADCAGRQVCRSDAEGSRCAEPATCGADEDCLGARICDGEVCAAPQCLGDIFEGNASPATAQRLEGDLLFRGLTSCGPDWFVLNVPANTVATISLRQLDRQVDLDLALGSPDGRLLERASTGMPVEALVIGPGAAERDVLFAVLQNGPPSVGSYDLEIAMSGAGDACLDDAAELGAGDDTVGTARVVRGPADAGFGPPVTGRICPGDEDWICFSMRARESFTATAQVVGGAVLVAELVEPDAPARVLATGRWGGAESVNIEEALQAQTYCLRLTSERGSGAYTISLNAFTAAMRRVCTGAQPLIAPGSDQGSVDGQLPDELDDSMSPFCAHGQANGGEQAFSVTVDGPRLLTARVAGLGSGTLGDPVLSVRRDCAVGSSEMACSTGWVDPDDPFLPRLNPAELRAALPEAGTYTLLLDGIGVGRSPTYRLEAEVTGLAAPPRNDGCERAERVTFQPGSYELSVNLDQATDVFTGCLGTGGPDAVYAVTLPEEARVTVRAFSQPAGFAVGAYLTTRCGMVSPVACGFGFEERLPAGEYFLVVDGVDASARGRAVIEVTVDAVGAPPANDACPSALVLEGATGEISGDSRAATDVYQLGDNNRCTGHASVGGDLAYRLPVQAGRRVFVEAVPAGGWDLSLYVVSDCDDLLAECHGSDGALTEAVVFTPAADGERFVVVDGAGGESGRFTLRWGLAECANDGECGGGRCTAFRCVGAP